MYLFTTACGLIATSWLLNDCFFWNCAPSRNFSVFHFEIPREYFPEGSDYGPLQHIEDSARVEALGGAIWYPGSSTYTVGQYGTIPAAAEEYAFISRRFRVTETREVDVSAVKSLSVEFPDEFHIACGEHQLYLQHRCLAIFRYQEFVIHLEAVIDDEMSVEMFIEMVSFLDARAGELIYSTVRP